ncbi:Peroxisomal nicotinamide adenine dinucleotide carrier [Capsicum annuum]|nr:Peroxisomal nicotinamide adenine dinucleotide carrier [Capsicum annuum]KAF3669874.1 Peroxisomal nicotinamide adenine dinucleotide carrier [Capsicum annuum]
MCFAAHSLKLLLLSKSEFFSTASDPAETYLELGVYYYFYQVFKNKVEAIEAADKKRGREDGSVRMFSWLVVAALAGSLNVLLANPLWVLVTQTEEVETIVDCLFSVQQFSNLNKAPENEKATQIFVIGAFAKLGATVCTSVGCEVKASSKAADCGNVSLRYSGTADAIIKMICHEGFRCFYQGMRIKIVQSVFADSVLFMVKEELVKVFAVLANKSMVKSIAVDIKRPWLNTDTKTYPTN